jgi:uncharacterized surface protein with fasciclin (FAS1) repeats
MERTLNIIDTAMRSGVFQTFTRLIEGSTLERTLRSKTTYTLFAPSDIAFAFLADNALGLLLRAESEGTLIQLLSYHVVSGRIRSRELNELRKVKTEHGQELTITNFGELRIDGSKLLQADIEASNGVIHAVDRLLLPAVVRAAVSA